MNNNSKNMIWNKSWSGPRGIAVWWMIVALASCSLAAIVTVFVCFRAPQQLYYWCDNLSYLIRLKPGLMALIIWLELWLMLMSAMALVFAVYRLCQKAFARRISSGPEPVGNPSKMPQ